LGGACLLTGSSLEGLVWGGMDEEVQVYNFFGGFHLVSSVLSLSVLVFLVLDFGLFRFDRLGFNMKRPKDWP